MRPLHVGFAGLITPRRQAQMSADIPRLSEPFRLVDRGAKRQRRQRTDAGTVISRRHVGSTRTSSSTRLVSLANLARHHLDN